MAIFIDDFDRANGALGGNWVTIVGTPTISGNAVGDGTYWATYNSTVSDTTHQEASCNTGGTHYSGYRAGPMVCHSPGLGSGFVLHVFGAAAPYYLRITNGASVGGTIVGQVELAGAPPPYYNLKLVWDQGHLSGYLNGSLLLEADSGDYYGHEYMGIAGRQAGHPAYDFRAVGGSAVSLVVTPNPAGNFGTPIEMAATGQNVSWTPGSPGSPALTVSVGTISNQVTSDSSHMTFTWTVGNFLGPATFTDPTTGETCIVIVSSNPAYLPSGACPFTDEAVDMINDTAGTSMDKLLLTTDTQVSSGSNIWTALEALAESRRAVNVVLGSDPESWTGSGLLYTLWQLINNLQPHSAGYDLLTRIGVVKADTQEIAADMTSLRTISDYTLQSVIDLIRGTEMVSNTDLMGAISEIQGSDLQPVLDAIAAARGTPEANIREVVTQLDALRTINDWTLGNVKTWIEAIPTGSVDLSPVLTAISNLSGQLTTSTSTIVGDVGEVATTLTTVTSEVGLILELVQALAGQNNMPPIITPTTEPDYGDPVAIAEAMQIDVPMAGLLVDVIDLPSGVREYPVGEFSMIFRAGYLAFINPLGYVEQPQYLSFTKGIYTPKTCTEAIGVLVKPNQGQTGTVTPFTLNGA